VGAAVERACWEGAAAERA
jgi:hypothetical protein